MNKFQINYKSVGCWASNVVRKHIPDRLTKGHGHRAPTFTFSRYFLLTACCLLITFSFSELVRDASAGVTVFDTVTMTNEPVRLKALTKGRLFSEGGKLVTFYVNGRNLGTTLSGGDGYAFMLYKTSSPGIEHIRVESGEDSDEGTVLIAENKDRVIMIEIESALFDSLLSFKPAEESVGALTTLSKKFRVLYVTTLVGMEQSRKWLKDKGFPASPVLKWEGEELIDDLKEKRVPLYAIVASPDLLSEASGIEKRFSFAETEDGTEVEDWDELLQKLK
jgi:hypothetical protein